MFSPGQREQCGAGGREGEVLNEERPSDGRDYCSFADNRQWGSSSLPTESPTDCICQPASPRPPSRPRPSVRPPARAAPVRRSLCGRVTAAQPSVCPSIRGCRKWWRRNRQTYHLTSAIIRDHWSERAAQRSTPPTRRRSRVKGRDALPKASHAAPSVRPFLNIGEIHSISRKMGRESTVRNGGAAFGQRRVASPRGAQ